jgi:hypothetical protein
MPDRISARNEGEANHYCPNFLWLSSTNNWTDTAFYFTLMDIEGLVGNSCFVVYNGLGS